MLRFVGETEATVWVETSGPGVVEVLGARSRTFAVAGHHYALVCVDDLEPGAAYAYEVLVDGRRVWPEPDSPFPPSRIRTLALAADRVRIAFGSCRISAPHEPPYVLPNTQHEKGRGIDVLRVYGAELANLPPQTWPDLLLLLGDQLYSDDLSPEMTRIVRKARSGDGGPLVDELVTFREFALAYRESWTEPTVRWLLSTIPSAMVFDDHEVRDAWKISQAWLEEKRAEEWYEERVAGALASYWIYQHLGNLAPAELRETSLLTEVREAADAWELLRGFAVHADREAGHSRWSFSRRLGPSRLVVMDSRAGRVLTPGARRIVEPGEWDWIEDQVDDVDGHLLLASSVPVLLSRGLHHFESWVEAVCDGRWGDRLARIGERIRHGALLDHWPAFDHSFQLLTQLVLDVAAGRRGRPPASVLLLSGDVHHSYTARIRFPAGLGVRTSVWQLVCSPLRMYFPRRHRLMFRFAESRLAALLGRGLARTVRVPASPLDWDLVARPSFDNQVATLDLDGPRAVLRVATSAGSDWRHPRLRTVYEHELTAQPRS